MRRSSLFRSALVVMVLLLVLTVGCGNRKSPALSYFCQEFGFTRSDGSFATETLVDTYDSFLGDGDSVYRMIPDGQAAAWLRVWDVRPLPVEGKNLIVWITEQYGLELRAPDTCRWCYLNRSKEYSAMPPNASFCFYDEEANILYYIRYDM